MQSTGPSWCSRADKELLPAALRRGVGYALGIAGLGVVVQSRIASHLHLPPGVHNAPALGRPVAGGLARAIIDAAPVAARPALHHAIQGAFASGLNGALLIAGAAGLLGAAVALIALHPKERPDAPPAGSTAESGTLAAEPALRR